MADCERNMTYTTWSNDFSVGVPVLDGQHIALLNLCKRAANCLKSDMEGATGDIQEILGQLVSYTENHFRDEEHLLRESNYPGFAAHRAEHVEYSTRLTGFLLDAGNGSIDRVALFEYLLDWWELHILCADKAYMAFLSPPD
jgi:hemerythrin